LVRRSQLGIVQSTFRLAMTELADDETLPYTVVLARQYWMDGTTAANKNRGMPPKLTEEELSIVAQALRFFWNARIGDSLKAGTESAQQDLRRRAEAAGELALRFERAKAAEKKRSGGL
jgi:hypothetical protein